MGKHRVVHTPEQRLEYWKKRIFDKQRSAVRQFVSTFKDANDMARHIGVEQEKLTEVADLFDKTMEAFTKLVYSQKIKEQDETAAGHDKQDDKA